MESGQDETKSEEATPKLKVHNLMFRAKLLVLDSADTTGLEALEIWPETMHSQQSSVVLVLKSSLDKKPLCDWQWNNFFFP